MTFRIFATTDIGQRGAAAAARQGLGPRGLRARGAAARARSSWRRSKSGIDALITTLRDKIDDEVFAAGKEAGLKVVAQDAVGFDNIDRAAANRHRIPFSNTADVLTDATAEFAFLIMGTVARMTWPSEQMVREQTWSTWHPYHPWLGDEVTGKTVAVIGTGRIGKSFIKKAVGFDMDVLCYDPAYQDDEVRGVHAPRDEGAPRGRADHARCRRSTTCRSRTRCAAPTSSPLHVNLTRPGEADGADLPPHGRAPPAPHEADRLPRQHLARSGGGRDRRWPARCAKAGSRGPRSTSSRRSRCPPTARCATRR